MQYASSMTSRFPSALEMSFGTSLGPQEISWMPGMHNPIHSSSRHCTDTISVCMLRGIMLKRMMIIITMMRNDKGARGRLSIWRWPIPFFSRPPACYAPLIDPSSSSFYLDGYLDSPLPCLFHLNETQNPCCFSSPQRGDCATFTTPTFTTLDIHHPQCKLRHSPPPTFTTPDIHHPRHSPPPM